MKTFLVAICCLLHATCGVVVAKPGDWKPVTPAPDFSGVVSSKIHLNGVLVKIEGQDRVIIARHLGAVPGQQVIIDGQTYTLAEVRRVTVKQLDNARYLGGDASVATLKEMVPPGVTRYPFDTAKLGTAYCLRKSGEATVHKFGQSYQRWLRGNNPKAPAFINGDSGRPLLTWDKSLRRWEVSGVISRIWWGEWLHLHSAKLTP